jgi:hypothetical protein
VKSIVNIFLSVRRLQSNLGLRWLSPFGVPTMPWPSVAWLYHCETKRGLDVKVRWCSWLSRQSNTLKVSSSNLDRIKTLSLLSHILLFGTSTVALEFDFGRCVKHGSLKDQDFFFVSFFVFLRCHMARVWCHGGRKLSSICAPLKFRDGYRGASESFRVLQTPSASTVINTSSNNLLSHIFSDWKPPSTSPPFHNPAKSQHHAFDQPARRGAS